MKTYMIKIIIFQNIFQDDFNMLLVNKDKYN